MIICVDHRKVKNLTCRNIFLMNSSQQLTLNILQNPSNCREKIFSFVIVSSYNMFATAGQLFPKINLIELFDMYLSMKIQSLFIMKKPYIQRHLENTFLIMISSIIFIVFTCLNVILVLSLWYKLHRWEIIFYRSKNKLFTLVYIFE